MTVDERDPGPVLLVALRHLVALRTLASAGTVRSRAIPFEPFSVPRGVDMQFRSTVELGGKTATGLQVPDEIVDALGAGRRPAVVVTVNGYSYRTTVASMGGRFLVPLSAENRAAAGAAAGDEIEVGIVVDDAPRETALPAELAAAFVTEPDAASFFEGLAPSHRKEWVRWIEDAKKPETRQARLKKTVTALREGRKTR